MPRKSRDTRPVAWEKLHPDNLTPEAAYWIGMLMADGCVSIGRSAAGRGQLSLKLTDREVVSAFAAFLGIPGGYTTRQPKVARHQRVYRFRRTGDLDLFAMNGLVPRKTGIEYVPDHLAGDLNFWRGVWDGDGCLTRTAVRSYGDAPKTLLVGSLEICERWVALCARHDIYSSTPTNKDRNGTGMDCTRTDSTTQNAIEVANLLYSDVSRMDSYAMPRKLMIAYEWLRLDNHGYREHFDMDHIPPTTL